MSSRSTRTSLAWGLMVLGTVAVLPLALNRFVLIKVAVCVAGAALAWTLPRSRSLPRLARVILCAAAGALVVAALLGDAPLAQVIGRAPRYEGLLGVGAYAAVLLAAARLPMRRPLLLALLSVGACLVSGLALVEALGWHPLVSDVSRPGSLLGNASEQGNWSLLAAGPLLAARRWPWAAVALAGVALSGSRGALLGAAAVLLVLLAAQRGARVALAGCLLGLVAVSLALPATRARVTGSSPLASSTAHGRQLLVTEGLSLARHHPVLGVGPSGYADEIARSHSARWYDEVGAAEPPDSPHSWPVQALLAGGPLLLAAAIATGVLVLRRVRDEPGAVAALAGYAVALLFHFTSPGATLLAAVLAGVVLGSGEAPGPAPRRGLDGGVTPALRRAPAVVGAGLCAVLALVALLGALAEIPLRSAIVRLAAGDVSGSVGAFDAAGRLRPWDADLAVVRAHALVSYAAQTRVPAAVTAAGPAVHRALERLPSSRTARIDQVVLLRLTGGGSAELDRLQADYPGDPEIAALTNALSHD